MRVSRLSIQVPIFTNNKYFLMSKCLSFILNFTPLNHLYFFIVLITIDKNTKVKESEKQTRLCNKFNIKTFYLK